MFTQYKIQSVLTGILILISATVALAGNTSSTENQISALETMCSESASAQTDRQSKNSLYNRLGGYDKILEFTSEVVRRHYINDSIKHMFTNVDPKLVAKHVADFVAAGTGGTAQYTGRSMPASHAHLDLTDADFLSAGGDIVGAMKSVGYGQNEIDEMLCILMSLKDQVVFK
jgi:hemoglobin